MGFEIALMDGDSVEFSLDDDIGFSKSFFRIAFQMTEMAGDIALDIALAIGGLRSEFSVQHCRLGGHCLTHIDDSRQHLVIDLDQPERFAGDFGRFGGHNRHAIH